MTIHLYHVHSFNMRMRSKLETRPLIEHVLTDHHSDLGLTCISESPLSTDNRLTRLVDGDLCINYGLFSIIIKLNLHRLVF